MKRIASIGLALLLSSVLLSAAASQETKDRVDAPELKTLKVKVSYRGAGTVDKAHGVHVFVFDSPDFVRGDGSTLPIDMKTAYANGEILTFDGLRAGSVYLTAAYDEKGTYDPPQGPPPQGTPVALYLMGDPQAPTPIEFGEKKEVEVTLEFDDSTRMS